VGLTRIINATFRDQYEEAVRIADSMIKVYPDHPAPYFFKAATLQGWMSTYRISNFQDEMEENTQKAIDVGDALLEKEYNPWLHFYVGGAYGYRGFNRFRKLNFIGAYRDAQRGINHFEEALEKDSTLYDVYLGLGSYYYWRTAKSKFLRLITFWMPDKRKLGMDQLNFVIHHGRYAIYESIYVLLAAYYNEGMYEKGLQLVNEAIQEKESPNLTDLYFKGRFLVLNGNWPEIQKIFTTMLDRILDYKYPSIGYQVECKYWIARALDQQGQEREALFTARDALMLSRKRDSDKEIEGHIDSFDDIRSELEKFHSELNDRLMKHK
jgi:tetratricopeptide (TPR) repeat protein